MYASNPENSAVRELYPEIYFTIVSFKTVFYFYRLDFLNPKAVNQSRPREFKESSVDSGQGKHQVLYLTILSFHT